MAKRNTKTDLDDSRDRVVLRQFLLVAQGLSFYVTWDLWQVRGRDLPPNLPLFEWFQFSVGTILVATLIVAYFRPLLGIACHSIVLVAAIAMDQLRIQPGFISMAILLWATLPNSGTILLGRSHLFALWFFAGFHKLFSADYAVRASERFVSFLPALHLSLAYGVAIVGAIAEVVLALLLIMPRTRRAAVWVAAVLHGGILFYLMSKNWNHAVWPWNVALIAAAVMLIRDWKSSLSASLTESRVTYRLAAGLLLVMPVGFYFGLVNPYVAHCLYSDNVPVAWIQFDAIEKLEQNEIKLQNQDKLSLHVLTKLRVPIPPEHRLFDAYFRRVASRYDVMIVLDSRSWAKRQKINLRHVTLDGEYRNGKKHGPWVIWTEDGDRAGEGSFRDGKMDGPWKVWLDDGSVKNVTYDNDELVVE